MVARGEKGLASTLGERAPIYKAKRMGVWPDVRDGGD